MPLDDSWRRGCEVAQAPPPPSSNAADFANGVIPPLNRYPRIHIDANEYAVEAAHKAINRCYRDSGGNPHMLVMGWRDWMELGWAATRGRDLHITEFMGIPILVLPGEERVGKRVSG